VFGSVTPLAQNVVLDLLGLKPPRLLDLVNPLRPESTIRINVQNPALPTSLLRILLLQNLQSHLQLGFPGPVLPVKLGELAGFQTPAQDFVKVRAPGGDLHPVLHYFLLVFNRGEEVVLLANFFLGLDDLVDLGFLQTFNSNQILPHGLHNLQRSSITLGFQLLDVGLEDTFLLQVFDFHVPDVAAALLIQLVHVHIRVVHLRHLCVCSGLLKIEINWLFNIDKNLLKL